MASPKHITYVLHVLGGIFAIAIGSYLSRNYTNDILVSIVGVVFDVGGLLFVLSGLWKLVFFKRWLKGVEDNERKS